MNARPTEMRDQAETKEVEAVQEVAEAAQAAAEGPARDSVEIIAELQAKIDSLEDSLLRAKADFQNLQRRSAAERSDAIRYANAELMKPLLNVLDDFERALAAPAPANSAAVLDGVKLVYQNLAKALGEFGLQTIDAQDQAFDPSIHEALLHQPTADAPPGTVIEQVAKGYKLRDRVLRPARVVVAKAPQDGGQ